MAAVTSAVQAVTGTADPVAAGNVLQQSPAATAQLRVQLAQLAAGQESAAPHGRTGQPHGHACQQRGGSGPGRRSGRPEPPTAWSAPVISAVVLLTFGSVMILVLTLGVPAGNETIANMLLGTLAAMATSVVSYWVGSSAGSARKEERLAQTSK